MQLKKMSMLALLVTIQCVSAHFNPYMNYVPRAKDPCRKCPTPCSKATTDELEGLPVDARQNYKRNKEILHAQESTEKLSKDALLELKEIAKNEGDFETFAEAHHRLKIEVATEDDGATLVFRVKDLAIPVVGLTIVAGSLGALVNHYFSKK